MRVFVTGGSGQTGPAIIRELIRAGHTVVGLARSDESAKKLQQLGARVLSGSLDDTAVLARGARESEGVVHMAFGDDRSDPDSMAAKDCAAISAMGEAAIQSGKPLLITSGTLAMSPGHIAQEHDSPDPQSLGSRRIPGERTCLGFASRGVRAAVIRLAPTVHGEGDYGFIPFLISVARRTGVSAYVDDGANRWPAVHRLDAATLFRLALEKAPAGSVLHGAAESGVTFQTIARLIGQSLELPTVSVAASAAEGHFGNSFFAKAFAVDLPVSSAFTREMLGWKPEHATLLEDLRDGDYFSPQAFSAFDER